MDGTRRFPHVTPDGDVIFMRHDYSHPRHTKISTDDDISNLPSLPQEYSVTFEQFDNDDYISAIALIRVRPDRRKSAWVEFHNVRKGHMKRVPIGLVGKLNLAR